MLAVAVKVCFCGSYNSATATSPVSRSHLRGALSRPTAWLRKVPARGINSLPAEETARSADRKCPLSREPAAPFSRPKWNRRPLYLPAYHCGALRSAGHGFNLAVRQPGAWQRLVVYEFLIIGYRPCLFRCRSALRPGWHRDRPIPRFPFGRAAGSLLFCRTAGPVTTADLWIEFFAIFRFWIVVCGATWLDASPVRNSPPWCNCSSALPLAHPGLILIWVLARCAGWRWDLLYSPRPENQRIFLYHKIALAWHRQGRSPLPQETRVGLLARSALTCGWRRAATTAAEQKGTRWATESEQVDGHRPACATSSPFRISRASQSGTRLVPTFIPTLARAAARHWLWSRRNFPSCERFPFYYYLNRRDQVLRIKWSMRPFYGVQTKS